MASRMVGSLLANSAETGVYIEIVTDPYAASALATRMHEEFRKLYR